jgi:FtsH-binding integral membrane protein
MPERAKFEDFRAPINIRLALAWTALMFLYIYNDYFSLYTPGTIAAMAKGSLGPIGPATDKVLAALAILLAIPALMIFLSAVLPPRPNRWLNGIFGVIYTLVEALTLSGSPLFYKIIVVAEIVLTALIVFYALRWPRRAPTP